MASAPLRRAKRFRHFVCECAIVPRTSSCRQTCEKISATIGTSIVLVLMARILDCSSDASAMLLIALLGVAFSCEAAGAFVAIVSIAPPFVGTISSIAALFGAIGGIICPNVVSLFLVTGSASEWRTVLYATALVNVLAGVVFLLLGSGKHERKKTLANKNNSIRSFSACSRSSAMG